MAKIMAQEVDYDDKKVEEAPFTVDWRSWNAWEPISLEWIPHPSTVSSPPTITAATTLLYHGCPSEFGETIIKNGFKKFLVNKTYGTLKFDGVGHNFYIDWRKPRPDRKWYEETSSEDTDEDEEEDKDANLLRGLHEATQYGLSKKPVEIGEKNNLLCYCSLYTYYE